MLGYTRSAVACAVVLTALVVTTTAGAAERQGPKLVPFRATAAGTYQVQPPPPNVVITATGVGRATHLGRFDFLIRNTVTPVATPAPGCIISSTETFTATLTAANGDTISLVGTGTSCQNPPTVGIVDVATVTGGTGRFEGATGSVTVTTTANQTARTEVIRFDGAIAARAAKV
jgi:hypothetical protein